MNKYLDKKGRNMKNYKTIFSYLIIASFVIIICGCGIGSIIQFNFTEDTAYTQPKKVNDNKHLIYIRSVNDKRNITNVLPDASKGKVDMSTEAIPRMHMDQRPYIIGRGMNNRPLALVKPMASIIKDVVSDAYTVSGYTVIDSEQPNTTIIDVDINKYWTWGDWGTHGKYKATFTEALLIQEIIINVKPNNAKEFTAVADEVNMIMYATQNSFKEISDKALGALYFSLVNKIREQKL